VCGLKFAIVFDLSASISAGQLVDMKDAGDSVVTALTGTASDVGVYTFGTWAPAFSSAPGGTSQAPTGTPAANGPLPASPVLTGDQAAVVQNHINNIVFPPTPTGQGSPRFTNWQQGLLQTLSRYSGTDYNVVLFVTDGLPTATGGPIPQPPSTTGTTVQTSSNPTGPVSATFLNPAITAANTLKTQTPTPTRVVAIGAVPTTGSLTVPPLQAISGQTQNTDWFLTTFAGLGPALQASATESCQGTLTVVKEVQDIHGNRTPGQDWTFTASPSPGTATSPTGGLTGPDGSTYFAVDFGVATTSMLTVSEDLKPGFALLPQTVGSSTLNAVCTDRDAPVPGYTNGPGPPGHLFVLPMTTTGVYSCLVVNRQLGAALTLVKDVHNLANSGTAQPDDWTLHATGPAPSTATVISGASGCSAPVPPCGVSSPVLPGTYTLSETGGPSGPPGYTASAWVCTINGVTHPAGTTVTLAANDAGVCTITNTEVPVVRLLQDKIVDLASAVSSDTLTYTMTVKNIGTGPTGAFTATDTLPPTGVAFVSAAPSVGTATEAAGVVTWNIPAPGLAVNQTATLTIVVTVTAAPAAGATDRLVNMFLVHPPGGSEPTEVENPCPAPDQTQSCAVTEVVGPEPFPQLFLSKTVNLTQASPGDTLIYTIEVLNSGNTTETAFTATDTLPPGVTFVSATPSTGTFDAASFTWSIPSLAPSAHATLTITVTVNATATEATTQLNKVTLTPPTDVPVVVNPDTECVPPETNSACAETVIPGVPRLTQSKTVNMATAVVGDHLTYTVTVDNTGTAAADNVVAHDTLPPDVTFVSATASQGSFAVTTGMWTIGTIAPAQTVTLTIVVTVEPGAEATTLINRFHVEAPPGGEDITVNNPCTDNAAESCAETVVPGVPRLTQNKVVNLLQAPVGSTLTYTKTISNPSPPSTAAAENVTATDRMPAGVTLVSATPSQGTFNSATGVWTVGTIALNHTAALTLVLRINSGTEGTILVNTFVVDRPPGGPPPVVHNPCVETPGGSCALTWVPGASAAPPSPIVPPSLPVTG
jgi:uncharacterized repeat protein (TIGR01451 family)